MKFLCYSNSETQQKIIKEVLKDNKKYEVEFMDSNSLDLTIEEILSHKSIVKSNVIEDSTLFYLLLDFEEEEIKEFFSFIKSHEIDTPYISTLTPTNKKWKLMYLINEVKEEHQFFQVYEKLKALILESFELSKQAKDSKFIKLYQVACMKGYECLKQKQKPSLKDLKQCVDDIEEIKKVLIQLS